MAYANQPKYPKEVPIIWKKYLQLHIKLPAKSIQNHCTALIYIYNTRIKSISQFPKSEIEIAIPIQSLTKTSGKLKSFVWTLIFVETQESNPYKQS